MVIRPFRKGDGPLFIALVRALARYEKLTPPGAGAAKRLVHDEGRRHHTLMAFVDGSPVGYAIWFPTYSSFLARPTLYLEDLFILPCARGRGVGRALFRVLRREARRLGAGRMEWIVLDWNTPAHRFYRRLGLRPLKGWVPYRLTLPR